MKDQFRREGAEQQAAASKVYVPLDAYTSSDPKRNEWSSLRDEFKAAMREGTNTIKDILDEQFRRRFGELMHRSARHRDRSRQQNDGDIIAVASL
ncbi:MAG TPA: hypothetical protein VKG24_16030 [Pseudolabrys sp.]|nr:hypothetical protein [Pseudolabrys sp.]